MGDAASTLISGPTEEALREAAQEEVQQLTKVFTKICMVSSKFLRNIVSVWPSRYFCRYLKRMTSQKK